MRGLLGALFLLPFLLCGQSYSTYFGPTRLRVNLVLAGDAVQQSVYLESLNEEPQWGGSRTQLIDRFEYGEYYLKVFSSVDGTLIYSRGFSSLFYEWRTTEEARRVARAHSLSLTLPMPKAEVRIELFERHKTTGAWRPLFATAVRPDDRQIRRGKAPHDFVVRCIAGTGTAASKVDIALLAEGYTRDEMEKFRRDAARLTEYLFSVEPFASHRDDFNIWTVESVSDESGTDLPHRGVWRNTAADASFYTFGIDRYLTAPNHTRLCELAWNVPYDALYVLVNTDLYGGGGVYNFSALCSVDHRLSGDVFVHEFGHSFAGLADEYYTSEVAYESFYPLDVEPWEPNLTTRVAFDRKWHDLVLPTTPVPTPDRREYARLVGLFEGGGYMAKGIFRPAPDCRMKSNATPAFCPVCRRALVQMIEAYR
jgi:hypothetical protein